MGVYGWWALWRLGVGRLLLESVGSYPFLEIIDWHGGASRRPAAHDVQHARLISPPPAAARSSSSCRGDGRFPSKALAQTPPASTLAPTTKDLPTAGQTGLKRHGHAQQKLEDAMTTKDLLTIDRSDGMVSVLLVEPDEVMRKGKALQPELGFPANPDEVSRFEDVARQI
ncbi:hypothetical protein E2562_003706 [Oryza meyeriana var. granulata]|uniref:Uncharacterized protein n=1 Tax=Oryza meyeriana var. granulata TaxID=110450 RepID=A0A6G1C3S8_9ORYZ|nr:hypothetical protein E2562_003706 [Oryza meyeriana var. granulata]